MTLLAKTATAASAIAVAGLLSVASATPAAALFDVCKDVNIQITNKTGGPIKLYDLDYRDLGSNRWRSENISNRTIGNNATYRTERNLEGVNRSDTFVRVQFLKLKSNGKWDYGTTWYYDSGTAKCKKGKTYAVTFY